MEFSETAHKGCMGKMRDFRFAEEVSVLHGTNMSKNARKPYAFIASRIEQSLALPATFLPKVRKHLIINIGF